jgi:nicotinamide-nucleotide amidase
MLGVERHMIEAHGAVSAQVARAIAEGARVRLAVDLVAGLTGVAGPGGGSDAKPVGLTYVAVAGPDGTVVTRHVWHGDRSSNRAASARAALDALIEVASRAAAARQPERPARA